jgi:hypothetical protein
MKAVIDTNVLLVANEQHADVSTDCVTTCVQRLQTIRQAGLVVIDDGFRILGEYQQKTSITPPKGVGDVFLKWLLREAGNAARVAQVALTETAADCFAEFPDSALESQFDAPDRKFAAVAHAHPDKPPIWQATDCKWLDWRGALRAKGVTVEFLCPKDVCRLVLSEEVSRQARSRFGQAVMSQFFRYPHTPHLAWLGDGAPRDDKVLSAAEARDLLAGDVVVEEKLDGANLGFSLSPDGGLLAQNRGQYLAEPYTGQFARLPAWMALHRDALMGVLTPNLLLFGEWCAARHSLDYNALPDLFLLFDVCDRFAGRFWSVDRRNALARTAGLATPPEIFRGHASLSELKRRVSSTPSRFRAGALEGVVIRRESGDWSETRAKLVRPDFAQAIKTHWRKRTIEWNRMGILRQHATAR